MKFLRTLFGPTPTELIDLAILRAAQASAERDAAGRTAIYYVRLLADIDPHTDWWRFAELKERHAEATAEHMELSVLADAATQNVEALLCK